MVVEGKQERKTAGGAIQLFDDGPTTEIALVLASDAHTAVTPVPNLAQKPVRQREICGLSGRVILSFLSAIWSDFQRFYEAHQVRVIPRVLSSLASFGDFPLVSGPYKTSIYHSNVSLRSCATLRPLRKVHCERR